MQILWETAFSFFAYFYWSLTVVVFLINYCCVLFSTVKTYFVLYTPERDLKVVEDRLFFKMSVQCLQQSKRQVKHLELLEKTQ